MVAVLLGAGVSRATEIAYSSLPVFEMARIPKNPPAYVPGSAHAKGVFFGLYAPSGESDGFVEVFDTRAAAATMSSGGSVPDEALERQPCLFTAESPREEGGTPWTAIASQGFNSFRASNGTAVIAVHIEKELRKWDERGGALEMIDGWFDTRTRGFRVVSRSILELAKVATGPFGIRVLGARGNDAVHLVVVPPVPPVEGSFVRDATNHAAVQVEGEIGASFCQHVRMSLDASRGTGAHGSITYQVFESLPEEPLPHDVTQTIPMTRPMSVRPVEVHLSASRNFDAAEPVVSVGFHVGAPRAIQ